MSRVVRLLGIVAGVLLLSGFAVAQNGSDYYVEAEVDNATPFVGERMVYTLRFFAAADVTLPAQTRYQPSPFEGFWYGGELAEEQTAQQVGGRQYIVREIRTVLFPLRVGALPISSAGIVFPATVFRGEETLLADPVVVDVQPLPGGAPEGYNGAVGQFDMVASIDRTQATQGEPVTLTLTVTGTGNVEQLLPPELNVPQSWRMYAAAPVFRPLDNTVSLGEKVFSWQLVPGQTGEQVLPAVTLPFFDPSSLTYRSISTAPVTLNITPADSVPAAQPSTQQALSEAGLRPLKSVPANLNLGVSGISAIWWLCPLAGLPLLAVVGAGVWERRRRWLAQNHARLQSANALSKAENGLQSAAKLPPEQAYRAIYSRITGFLHDKADMNVQGRGHSELQALLLARGVSEEAARRFVACLERADEGRFAPSGAVPVSALVKSAIEALTAVEREWKSD
ncbi:MAG: BatD family protein [Anaerolineaceae bacterium]|nr:BatD family protein [Anaerolineaceae bacterium]